MNAAFASQPIPFSSALRVWIKIAVLSFGGPAAQIAVMHRILVEEKKWIRENDFLHALNYCMLLPGPEAQQLAIYTGWLLHGTLGGITAGVLFVLPGFLAIFSLSFVYAVYQEIPAVSAVFFGLKAAVLAIVAEAVIRVGKKVLKNSAMKVIASAAFLALFVFAIPFPAVILAAGLIGYFGGKLSPNLFHVLHAHAVENTTPAAERKSPSLLSALKTAGVWLSLWWIPVFLLMAVLGKDHVLVQQALFFSKTAMITFGGAYSVLSYIAQEAVHHYHWLQPSEMLTGLGMAETTPGPLIQVVQFVSFMGAYRSPDPFSPLTAAFLGSLVTTWVTYSPCFLWIFLGAPYIEHWREHRNLNAALSAITAAVVGVILNLALWLALHSLFSEVREVSYGFIHLIIPVLETLNWKMAAVSLLSFTLLFKFRLSLLKVISLSILAGMAVYFL